MAKKKIEEEIVEKVKATESAIFKDIKKTYGNVIKTGRDILNSKKEAKLLKVSPAIDLALKGGIREGSWIIMSGAPKCGKAQPIDEIVMTPNGPKKIGDLYLGDFVCTPNGKIVAIQGIFPQGYKDVYEVNFSDGTKTLCCGDHIWRARLNYNKSPYKDVTTMEMLGNSSYEDRNKWLIPCPEIVFFKEKELPLDPYFVGIMLSWARIRKDKIKFVYLPQHLVSVVAKFAEKYNCIFSNNTLISKDDPQTSGFISYSLKNIGANYYHKHKVVHSLYKYNSETNRTKLIQGIFTRGAYQHRDGYIEYDGRHKPLTSDVCEIARSLGLVCKLSDRNGEFRVTINTDMPSELLNKQCSKITKRKRWKSIEFIQKLDRQICKCIKLESEDGLYVTSGYNVTHNTTTAMQLALNCQLEGRPVIYINTECRLSQMNFDVEGLDPDKMIIVSPEDKPLSAEEFLCITEKLISDKAYEGALCIIDSISSLIPKRELEGDVSGSFRPGLPRVLSTFCKKAGQIVPTNRITMVMITHLITDTSGYGGKMADGGIKVQYQADTRMQVGEVKPWQDTEKKQIGQSLKWRILYSSLGACGECESWIRYGKGIDKIQELIVIGEELNLIEKGGAWYELTFLGLEKKINGQQKVHDYFSENPDDLIKLEDTIRGMIS